MIGETVVLAFRIEKFADESTGPILACPVTHAMACEVFDFREIGSKRAKGFNDSHNLYALVQERN